MHSNPTGNMKNVVYSVCSFHSGGYQQFFVLGYEVIAQLNAIGV
jgi:hypothetical protein